MNCPLCNRSDVAFSDHHLIPKTRGGSGGPTVTICTSCHSAIHHLRSNKQLESLDSVDKIMAEEDIARTIKFISKQRGQVKTKLANDQRRRGRNG